MCAGTARFPLLIGAVAVIGGALAAAAPCPVNHDHLTAALKADLQPAEMSRPMAGLITLGSNFPASSIAGWSSLREILPYSREQGGRPMAWQPHHRRGKG